MYPPQAVMGATTAEPGISQRAVIRPRRAWGQLPFILPVSGRLSSAPGGYGATTGTFPLAIPSRESGVYHDS